MTWKCPQCGVVQAEEAARRCEACGFSRGGGRLVLVAERTERRISVGVDTAIGKVLLETLEGDEHMYATEPQFLLSRDPAGGAWRIAPVPGATNPTYLNGAALAGAPTPLPPGSVISIGPDRMRLRVEIEP